jgi:hypothetical protein
MSKGVNMSNINFDTTKFSKSDVIKIIDIMAILEKACEERNIKFSKFSKDELYELFMIYRAYKLSPPPPF